MKISFARRRFLCTGAALGGALWLPSARACQFSGGHLRIDHPWMRATRPDAGFGVLCMTFDEVIKADRLIGVATPVCTRAEMGGPGARPEVNFEIPEGRVSVLSEDGTHVRLVGLKFQVEVGRSFPLTLEFEKAGTVPADIDVDFDVN